MSLCPLHLHFERVRLDGTIEGEVGDEGEEEVDDGLIGKRSRPLDVEDDQVEGWQEVELEDYDDGKSPGGTVEGERGILSTEGRGVLGRRTESPIEVGKELNVSRVVVCQGLANRP